MSELNPVSIEKSLLEISNEMSQLIIQARDGYELQLSSQRAYTLAYAKAYMSYEGPAHCRKYAADLATEKELVDRDAADVAFRYIDRMARFLEKKLSAYQTLSQLVKQAYAVAGRGEW